MVMSSIMRWRSGEIGWSSVNSCLWTAQNVQSLQTGDCLPMPSLRSSRPTGHDHYRNARQSDSQIQHAPLDNWATDLRHRLPTAERFSASGFMEYRPRSVGLRTGEFHHLCPLFGFVGYELAEIGGRACNCGAAQLGEPRLDLRIGESDVDFLVEHANNFGGRISGRSHAPPRARLKPRYKLAHTG